MERRRALQRIFFTLLPLPFRFGRSVHFRCPRLFRPDAVAESIAIASTHGIKPTEIPRCARDDTSSRSEQVYANSLGFIDRFNREPYAANRRSRKAIDLRVADRRSTRQLAVVSE